MKPCTENPDTCPVNPLWSKAHKEEVETRNDLIAAGGVDIYEEGPDVTDEETGHLALAAVKARHTSFWLAARCICPSL